MEAPHKRASSPPDASTTPAVKRPRSDAEKQLDELDESLKSVVKSELSVVQKLGPHDDYVQFKIIPNVFFMIVENSCGLIHSDWRTSALSSVGPAWDDILKEHPELKRILLDCLTEQPPSFRSILELAYLREPRPRPSQPSAAGVSTTLDPTTYQATVNSWNGEFKGSSAKVLHAVLQGYLKKYNHLFIYARLTTYVQSSGTGKSRTVDELAKRVVTIPLNLGGNPFAYPPSDDPEVRTWVLAVSNVQREAQKHYEAFLVGLLTVTKTCLEGIAKKGNIKDVPHVGDQKELRKDTLERVVKLASIFRDKMTELELVNEGAMPVFKYGAYRRAFYEEVKAIATSFAAKASPQKGDSPTLRYTVDGSVESEGSVVKAANALYKYLDPTSSCGQDLLLIIAFDEAHPLTDSISGLGWTRFSELRRALRALSHARIFAIFLSTAGKFEQFAPVREFDPSNRMQSLDLDTFEPFTEIGFDNFAQRVKGDGSCRLQQIASTYNIAHLGRALFATRYDHGDASVRQRIVGFASVKLLGREHSMQSALTAQMQLACLSVRLAIEFQAASWQDREQERIQVERHMRICLCASSGFQRMVTISPSEPILAEAAVELMRAGPRWSPAAALRSHIDSSFLSVGDRGELVASLLLLLARDATLKPYDPEVLADPDFQNKDGNDRVISVLDFLLSLLQSGPSEVQDHTPEKYSTAQAATQNLQVAFRDARIWFNHFIKARDFEVINRNSLCSAIVRGAAMVCANGHRGVDIVIPILFGDRLRAEQVSAILIQVKNDKSFGKSIHPHLFDSMNPFNVGLFSPGAAARFPVIRMVFALASREAGILYHAAPERTSTRLQKDGNAKFTAYDIWCAGATKDSFKIIPSTDEEVYTQLLLRSLNLSDPFKTKAPMEELEACETVLRVQARREMHPVAEIGSDHHRVFVPEAVDEGML